MKLEELAAESTRVGDDLVAYGRELLSLGQDLIKQGALLEGKLPKAVAPARPGGPGDNHSVGRNGLVDNDIARLKARELKSFTRPVWEEALGLKGTAASARLNALVQSGDLVRRTDEEGHILYDYVRSVDDEEPLYRVRMWAKARGQNGNEPFELSEAMEATELSEADVMTALTELVVEGVVTGELQVEQDPDDEEAEELDQATQIALTAFRYVPTLPGGLQSAQERQRLAAVMTNPEIKGRGQPVRIRTERKQGKARSTPGSRQRVVNNERNWDKLQEAKEKREREGKERAAKQRAQPKGRKRK